MTGTDGGNVSRTPAAELARIKAQNASWNISKIVGKENVKYVAWKYAGSDGNLKVEAESLGDLEHQLRGKNE